ncbi:MAG: DUF1127 domain-containing protein [Rhodospirillales bacterium]|jgi:uncharacterized protein YjiS (DUF1127 family)|nr:DUF1127 domain-containing protein [Rhodospirillales bacterium]MDP6774799.1 DUF1127 domain-containing protein [Rhodospirillales bacterium]|tara:strand:- start:450 stop:701 length:252 start_codon:yes stop_codon:yes gene_type:complete
MTTAILRLHGSTSWKEIVIGLAKVFATGVGPVIRWRDRQQAFARLRALSNHQLRDIGFRRSEFEMLAHGGTCDPKLFTHSPKE